MQIYTAAAINITHSTGLHKAGTKKASRLTSGALSSADRCAGSAIVLLMCCTCLYIIVYAIFTLQQQLIHCSQAGATAFASLPHRSAFKGALCGPGVGIKVKQLDGQHSYHMTTNNSTAFHGSLAHAPSPLAARG
jgi:hypothetical protein